MSGQLQPSHPIPAQCLYPVCLECRYPLNLTKPFATKPPKRTPNHTMVTQRPQPATKAHHGNAVLLSREASFPVQAPSRESWSSHRIATKKPYKTVNIRLVHAYSVVEKLHGNRNPVAYAARKHYAQFHSPPTPANAAPSGAAIPARSAPPIGPPSPSRSGAPRRKPPRNSVAETLA